MIAIERLDSQGNIHLCDDLRPLQEMLAHQKSLHKENHAVGMQLLYVVEIYLSLSRLSRELQQADSR
jgi:hypothetical protein